VLVKQTRQPAELVALLRVTTLLHPTFCKLLLACTAAHSGAAGLLLLPLVLLPILRTRT
jgi:hypothetical protein